jgi:hypothetical protein
MVGIKYTLLLFYYVYMAEYMPSMNQQSDKLRFGHPFAYSVN